MKRMRKGLFFLLAVLLVFLPYWKQVYYLVQVVRGKKRSALADPVSIIERLLKRGDTKV